MVVASDLLRVPPGVDEVSQNTLHGAVASWLAPMAEVPLGALNVPGRVGLSGGVRPGSGPEDVQVRRPTVEAEDTEWPFGVENAPWG